MNNLSWLIYFAGVSGSLGELPRPKGQWLPASSC